MANPRLLLQLLKRLLSDPAKVTGPAKVPGKVDKGRFVSPEARALAEHKKQTLLRHLQQKQSGTPTVEQPIEQLQGSIPLNATKPVTAPDAQGNIRTRGPGPGSLSSSGGAPFDPLEDAVRSRTVIEGSTRPIKVKGVIQRDPEGVVIRETVNPGVEARLRKLMADRQLVGDPKNLKGVSNSELEILALEQRAAEAASNQAKYAPKAKRVLKGTGGKIVGGKIVGGQRVDQYGNPMRMSEGNPDIQSTGPSEGFGEINLHSRAGTVKGDENLGQDVIREMDASQRQRRPGTEGPQKGRTKSQLDNLGRSEDEQRLLDLANKVTSGTKIAVGKGVPIEKIAGRVGEVTSDFGTRERINSVIQDIYTRFDATIPGFKRNTPDHRAFKETNIKTGAAIPHGLNQGSSASRLNDIRKQLGQLSNKARDPGTTSVQLEQIKKDIAKLDNEMFGTNNTFEELDIGYQRSAKGAEVNQITEDDLLPPSIEQSLGDESGDTFTDFVSRGNAPDANVQFSGRSDVNELGPKMQGSLLRHLQQNPSGFTPNPNAARPVNPGGQFTQESVLKKILEDIQQGKLGAIDAPGTSNVPAVQSIPAPRNTTVKDNIVEKVRRGVTDRDETGFSMTENQFDQFNIDAEKATDAERFLGQPYQHAGLPGQFDEDPVMDMIISAMTYQDDMISGIPINDLTEASLRKIQRNMKTGEIFINPKDVERLP